MCHTAVLAALTFATAVTLLGCGASAKAPTPTPVPPTISPAIAGNWTASGVFKPTLPITLPNPIASFIGALQVSGDTITGTVRAFSPNLAPGCPGLFDNLVVTGTLDAASNLTLTIPLSGGVATLTATLPQNLNSVIPGSYQIIGGTCPQPATAMLLAQVAPVTGTYTGTLDIPDHTTGLPTPATATTVTAALTQATTPDVNGQFLLTGTVTATGACAGTLPITNGIVTGADLMSRSLAFTPPIGPVPPLPGIFNGVVDPTAATMQVGFLLPATCKAGAYVGLLTRQ